MEEERLRIRGLPFDASTYDMVYCSPLRRCRQTAEALGIERWTPDARLAERNLGIFEGFTRDECERRFPAEFHSFRQFDATYEIPRGESRSQHLARTVQWLQEARLHPRVLAITHGGTIDFLYRMGREIDLHGGPEIFSASNVSLSSFDVQWPRIALIDYDVRLDT